MRKELLERRLLKQQQKEAFKPSRIDLFNKQIMANKDWGNGVEPNIEPP